MTYKKVDTGVFSCVFKCLEDIIFLKFLGLVYATTKRETSNFELFLFLNVGSVGSPGGFSSVFQKICCTTFNDGLFGRNKA
jgi:hypothetical protein